MTLEWKPFDHVERCAVTSCGRYSVSEFQGRWQAWKLAPGGPWFAPLGLHLDDEATAKETAERDSAS
jgi:hypothetical protein